MKYIQLFERFYKPSDYIENRISDKIKELLSHHKKGRIFFNELDQYIKDITNVDMVLSLLKGNKNEWIVSSGEFGEKIYDMWLEEKFECKGVLVFNGKMHSKNSRGITYYYPKGFVIKNKEYVFVDDSYFSGNTSNKINDFLLDYDSKIKSINVIYDGSREKNKMVKSFFSRYKVLDYLNKN